MGHTKQWTRWQWLQNHILVFLVFTAPVVLGEIGTALILALSLTYLHPFFTTNLWPNRRRSYLTFAFVMTFILMGFAFAAAAKDINEIRFVFNFSALLLAIPTLWSQSRVITIQISLHTISAAALTGAALAAATGIIGHHLLGIERVGWHVVNPIHFGNISVILGFLAVTGIFTSKRPSRWLFLAGPVLGIVGALYSGSRGPIVAAVGLGLVTSGFLYRDLRHSKKELLVILAIAVLTAATILLIGSYLDIGRISQMASEIWSLLTTGETDDRSMQLRLAMYAGGVQAFLASPIYGHGWWNLVASIEPFVPASTWNTISGFTHLHSDIVDFAVAAGILGLLAYGLLITAPIVSALTLIRNRHSLAQIYAASVLSVGFLISGFTNLFLGNGLQTTLYAFMAALIVGASIPTKARKADDR